MFEWQSPRLASVCEAGQHIMLGKEEYIHLVKLQVVGNNGDEAPFSL
jgi:hypothetical protein